MRRPIAPFVGLARLRAENDTIRQRLQGVDVSPRDRHIIGALASGKTAKDVARPFGLSTQRVMQIVAEAYQKMERKKNG